MSDLATQIGGSPYAGYAYAYPHKTAYRGLSPPVALADLWRGERRGQLFLYLHVPFCEMRCGFCNLFTIAHGATDAMESYVQAVEREAEAMDHALGERRFARFALGGGTPTFLPAPLLRRLFASAKGLGVDLAATPIGVETSPATADDERLDVLIDHGVDRVSIGVQSFDEDEARALGRPQRTTDVIAALQRIRARPFTTLNIDLIYGAHGQTRDSWLRSIDRALSFAPEEIYLYPLYVRPLTGLQRRASRSLLSDPRRMLYRTGRDHLLANGYTQVSMRMFRSNAHGDGEGPAYCCQRDGMVGLGPGARSYTSRLHYASEYAVGRSGVKAIIADYARRRDFSCALHGIWLNDEERHRRYVIQSILQVAGLNTDAFVNAFGTTPLAALPQLAELVRLELAREVDGNLVLTSHGFEWSDVIGPWLASPAVTEEMRRYAPR